MDSWRAAWCTRYNLLTWRTVAKDCNSWRRRPIDTAWAYVQHWCPYMRARDAGDMHDHDDHCEVSIAGAVRSIAGCALESTTARRWIAGRALQSTMASRWMHVSYIYFRFFLYSPNAWGIFFAWKNFFTNIGGDTSFKLNSPLAIISLL